MGSAHRLAVVISILVCAVSRTYGGSDEPERPIDPRFIGRLSGPGGDHVSFSPDDRRLLTVGGRAAHDREGNLAGPDAQVWDASSLKPLGKTIHFDGPVTTAAFVGDGEQVVLASADELRVARSDSGQVEAKVVRKGEMGPIAVSPDGSVACITVRKNVAELVELRTGTVLASKKHVGAVRQLIFGTDGKTVFAFEENPEPVFPRGGRLYAWDARIGKTCFATPQNNDGGGRESPMALSPAGDFIVVARLKCFSTYNTKTGREIVKNDKFDFSGTDTGVVDVVHLSSRGGAVLVQGLSWSRVWNPRDGTPMGKMMDVFAIFGVVAPDEKHVVLGGLEDAAGVWDVASGHRVQVFPHGDDVQSVTISPDGMLVAVGYRPDEGPGYTDIWKAEPAK